MIAAEAFYTQAAAELGESLRREREQEERIVASIRRRARAMLDAELSLIPATIYTLGMDIDYADTLLVDPLDRAVLRLLLVLTQSDVDIAMSKARSIVSEAERGEQCARGRHFYSLAAEICAAAAAFCEKRAMWNSADRLRCQAKLDETRGAAWSPNKFLAYFTFLASGFGYRPYRLFGVLMLVVAAIAVIASLTMRVWFPSALLLSAWNYLSFATFPAFVEHVPLPMKLVFAAESLSAIAINATLLALLGRIWFRFAR